MAKLLSRQEIAMLNIWDKVAARFRRKYVKAGIPFKDLAYQMIYAQLIGETIHEIPGDPTILKTDLWNEGIELGRDLASSIQTQKADLQLVGADVSTYVCKAALTATDGAFHIIRGTLLSPPFREVFDMIIDPSTVDHMPAKLRDIWIAEEYSLLKKNGILLISFDCKFNLFNELYHRIFTRKQYPEWTLNPCEVRGQLERLGFCVIREHALFIPGLFFGTHKPWFPLSRTLARRGIFEFIKRVELGAHSKFLTFLAPQYVILARKAR